MNTKRGLLIVAVAALAVACGGANDATITTTTRFATTPRDQVDILFVLDNSPGTRAQVLALVEPLTTILHAIEASGATPVSYHFGVITTDNGANGFVDSLKQCQPGGDAFGGGRLQAKGEAAQATCAVPTGGKRFVELDQRNGTNNLPAGQDLATTLACMSDVGSVGCGFEQPLETTYRALTDATITENADFLRSDALLAVVYVTDEDDCSAPPTSDVFDALPSTPPPAGLGLLNSYRCVKFGVVCTDPLTGVAALAPYDAAMGLTNCRPATQAEGGRLYDIDRYTTLFTKPTAEGGLKDNPNDVMVFAILGAPNPTTDVIRGNPSSQGPDGQPTPCTGELGSTCAISVAHSCISPTDSRFLADPAFRLNAVVTAAPNHRIHSMCDSDYQPLVSAMRGAIDAKTTGVNCLPFSLVDAGDCSVALASATIRQCDATATNKPCWRTGTDERCNPAAANATLVVERTDAAPAGDYTLTCKKKVAATK